MRLLFPVAGQGTHQLGSDTYNVVLDNGAASVDTARMVGQLDATLWDLGRGYNREAWGATNPDCFPHLRNQSRGGVVEGLRTVRSNEAAMQNIQNEYNRLQYLY